MIKRTIEISREPAHVTVQHSQLVLKREGAVVGQTPCEDVGVVLVDQQGVTYSHAALTALAESDEECNQSRPVTNPQLYLGAASGWSLSQS